METILIKAIPKHAIKIFPIEYVKCSEMLEKLDECNLLVNIDKNLFQKNEGYLILLENNVLKNGESKDIIIAFVRVFLSNNKFKPVMYAYNDYPQNKGNI